MYVLPTCCVPVWAWSRHAAFKREVDCREGLDGCNSVIKILGKYSVEGAELEDSYVAEKFPASSLEPFNQIKLSHEKHDGPPTSLVYLLVLEKGVADLSDVISHANIAGRFRAVDTVKAIAIGVAESLQELSNEGLIHGDVKARNFVEMPMMTDSQQKRYAIIDLDAAAKIGKLAAQKQTSSGLLPPEQAAVLRHRHRLIGTVYTSLKSLRVGGEVATTGLTQAHLEPFYDHVREYNEQSKLAEFKAPDISVLDDDQSELISESEFRAFFADPAYEGALDEYCKLKARGWYEHADNQPPAPVLASVEYDMWCFGLMLYELCTGRPLFKINHAEEADDAELEQISRWSAFHKLNTVGSVASPWPRGLMQELLSKDKRPQTWDHVIDCLKKGFIPFDAGDNDLKAFRRELAELAEHDFRSSDMQSWFGSDFERLEELLSIPYTADADASDRTKATKKRSTVICPGHTALKVAVQLEAEAAWRWLLDEFDADPEELGQQAVLQARVSNNVAIKKWGDTYGRLFGIYKLNTGQPKHISATCVVVFASQRKVGSNPGDNSAQKETPVALKFMSQSDAYVREKDGRPTSPFIIPILAWHDPENHWLGEAGTESDERTEENKLEFNFRLQPEGAVDLRICPQLKHIWSNESQEASFPPAGGIVGSAGTPQKWEYKYLIVLERGEQDLNDLMSHGRVASHDVDQVIRIATSIARCLQDLNEGNGTERLKVMHGDVKPRNFVRVVNKRETAFRAIDFDASSSIPEADQSEYRKYRKTTSIAFLPPEQAAQVLQRRLQAENAESASEKLRVIEAEVSRLQDELIAAWTRSKQHPKAPTSSEVSKSALHELRAREKDLIDLQDWQSFRSNVKETGTSRLADTPASQSYDMWGFGVLLFQLCSGQTLFQMDLYENTVDDHELFRIVKWTNEDARNIETRLKPDWKGFAGILGRLLAQDSGGRPSTWKDVIEALPGCSTAGNSAKIIAQNKEMMAKMDRNYDLSLGIAAQVENLTHELTACTAKLSDQIKVANCATQQLMLDLGDGKTVQVPYLFDIVDEMEPGLLRQIDGNKTTPKGEEEEKKKEKVNYRKRGEQMITLAGNLLETKDVAAVVAEAAEAAIGKQFGWCRGLLQRAKDVLKSPEEKAKQFINANSTKTVYLRLLCGITLKPVVVYSIPVQDDNTKVQLYLQKSAGMIKLGLKVAATWNFAASVTKHLCGVPLPSADGITKHLRDAKAIIEDLRSTGATSEGDVQAEQERATAGMTKVELGEFAKYLDALERGGSVGGREQPCWKEKMDRVVDPDGLVTFTTKERARRFGGDKQKAAIEASKAAAPPASDPGGHTTKDHTASTGQNAAPEGLNENNGGDDHKAGVKEPPGAAIEKNIVGHVNTADQPADHVTADQDAAAPATNDDAADQPLPLANTETRGNLDSTPTRKRTTRKITKVTSL